MAKKQSRRKISNTPGKKLSNTKLRYGILALAIGIMVGIPLGMLFQNLLPPPLQPEAQEIKTQISITISDDCILIINDTVLGERSWNFFDYADENITGNSMALIYGIYLNDSFTIDLKNSAEDRDSLSEVIEDLEDNDWEEKDAILYKSFYPYTFAQLGLGLESSNILADEFFFPSFNFTGTYPEPIYPDPLEDGLEFELDRGVILDSVLFMFNFSYENVYGMQNIEPLIFTANFFLDIPTGMFISFFPEDDEILDEVSIREEAIVLPDKDLEIEITEFYIDQENDRTTFISLDAEINGEDFEIPIFLSGS